MHLHRFFVADQPLFPAATVTLDPRETHHALHTVRLRVGDEVALLNGTGVEARGQISATSRHAVRVVLHTTRATEPPTARVTLCQAWLNREKPIEELIRHGTEVGISRFVFFRAQHSDRSPKDSEKWRRWAVESLKQCGRLWLPEFTIAPNLDAALDTVQNSTLFIATRATDAPPLESAMVSRDIAVFVGPEGDFTEEEVSHAAARGAKKLSLGAATYRAELASVVAASLILYELGELGPRNP